MPVIRRFVIQGMFLAIVAGVSPRALFAAPPPQAKIDAAVERGIAWLKGQSPQPGYSTLAAVALHKSDVPADTPAIARVVDEIVSRTRGDAYQPGSHHSYQAGLELMLLGDIDPEKYRREIEAITKYVLAGQNEAGWWYYPNQSGGGDTSISQYAMLGLWAAARAGIEVPAAAWDRAAQWHLKTQLSDGGWTYHPADGGAAGPTMVAAGFGSLHIARLHLHEGRALPRSRRSGGAALRFGVLERIDPNAPAPGTAKKTTAAPAPLTT